MDLLFAGEKKTSLAVIHSRGSASQRVDSSDWANCQTPLRYWRPISSLASSAASFFVPYALSSLNGRMDQHLDEVGFKEKKTVAAIEDDPHR